MLTVCLLSGVVMTTNTHFRGDVLKKVWLNRYPAGVPAEINPDRYQSLVELFEHSVLTLGFQFLGYFNQIIQYESNVYLNFLFNLYLQK